MVPKRYSIIIKFYTKCLKRLYQGKSKRRIIKYRPTITRFKIVVIGDSAVGKTSLLEQFVHNKFSALYRPTIGMDFLCKELQTQKCIAKLQIWDTAGQEHTKSVGVSYYRGADACILVYDLSSAESLQHLKLWKDNYTQQVGADHPIFVIKKSIDYSRNRICFLLFLKRILADLNVENVSVPYKILCKKTIL